MIEAALAVLECAEQRNELAEFYDKYKNRLFNIAYTRLNNDEEAEEAVQEAFIRVADNPDRFFDMQNRERVHFVDGIVRHISIDKFNKKIKDKSIAIEEVGDSITSGELSPEEKYITDRSAEELEDFILTLPEKQRQVLFMYVHQKLSYSDIANILDISEELARKRVSNARKAIKKFAERNN